MQENLQGGEPTVAQQMHALEKIYSTNFENHNVEISKKANNID